MPAAVATAVATEEEQSFVAAARSDSVAADAYASCIMYAAAVLYVNLQCVCVKCVYCRLVYVSMYTVFRREPSLDEKRHQLKQHLSIKAPHKHITLGT